MKTARPSKSAAACFSAMADGAKSAEMVKLHEFAGSADPSERKKAVEALAEINKAINFAESAMRCITIALRVGPTIAKRDIDVLRREFGDKIEIMREASEVLDNMS